MRLFRRGGRTREDEVTERGGCHVPKHARLHLQESLSTLRSRL